MRALFVFTLIVVSSCGDPALQNSDAGSLSPEKKLSVLSPSEQTQICTDFIAAWCPGITPFCNPCSMQHLCTLPALPARMNQDCANITVQQVQECIRSKSESVCMQGGGCLFDVGEALCPG